MTGLRLELANPNAFESPREYIEQHVAPVATELHRLVNEFLAPGSTSSEEISVDMVPSGDGTSAYWTVEQPLRITPKSVMFDGRDYFTFSKDVLRAKQLKVQLTATCYVKNGGGASFRLLRGDGSSLPASEFSVHSSDPVTVTRVLPFGEGEGCVTPHWQAYVMQARRLEKHSLPVCRRFSLSFLLI